MIVTQIIEFCMQLPRVRAEHNCYARIMPAHSALAKRNVRNGQREHRTMTVQLQVEIKLDTECLVQKRDVPRAQGPLAR